MKHHALVVVFEIVVYCKVTLQELRLILGQSSSLSTDSNMHDPCWMFANKNETLGI